MATACLVGSTGLVGSYIYTLLSTSPAIKQIHAYTRKDLPISEKLSAIQSSDSSSWPEKYPEGAEIFFSGLGTTRANAGGQANVYKVDHDLNLALAKAARAAGTRTYVLISAVGANSSSMFAAVKMKGELEDAVAALGFDHCIIVRPGVICGKRAERRVAEGIAVSVANAFAAVSGGRLKDPWAQDADVIAKAAVRAGLDCLEGKETQKFRILSQADIVRLGRTEWKEL